MSYSFSLTLSLTSANFIIYDHKVRLQIVASLMMTLDASFTIVIFFYKIGHSSVSDDSVIVQYL
jgi:hypothetical protein